MKAQSTRFLRHLCSGGTLDTQAEVVCLVILANLTENIRGSGDGDYAGFRSVYVFLWMF